MRLAQLGWIAETAHYACALCRHPSLLAANIGGTLEVASSAARQTGCVKFEKGLRKNTGDSTGSALWCDGTQKVMAGKPCRKI